MSDFTGWKHSERVLKYYGNEQDESHVIECADTISVGAFHRITFQILLLYVSITEKLLQYLRLYLRISFTVFYFDVDFVKRYQYSVKNKSFRTLVI